MDTLALYAGVTQLVEFLPSKQIVVGSSPITRFGTIKYHYWPYGEVVITSACLVEVRGSNPRRVVTTLWYIRLLKNVLNLI